MLAVAVAAAVTGGVVCVCGQAPFDSNGCLGPAVSIGCLTPVSLEPYLQCQHTASQLATSPPLQRQQPLPGAHSPNSSQEGHLSDWLCCYRCKLCRLHHGTCTDTPALLLLLLYLPASAAAAAMSVVQVVRVQGAAALLQGLHLCC